MPEHNQPEECRYCKRVQENRGGNKGYKCTRHTKRAHFGEGTTLYTKEYFNNLLSTLKSEVEVMLNQMYVSDTESQDESRAMEKRIAQMLENSGAKKALQQVINIIEKYQ